jgi:restriction endonuclease S subunit
MAVWNSVSLSELRGTFRLDAEFWQPDYLEVEAVLLAQSHDRLGDLVTSVRKGVFNILADSYVDDGVPFYRSSNVGKIFPKEGGLVFITPKRHAEESKTALRRGDIMLAKTGKEAASVVLREECNVSQDVVAVRPNRQRINPFYLAVFLNTSFGVSQMQRWFQGQVQAHLSLPDSRQILVPLLSPQFQSKIESRIHEAERALADADARLHEAEALLVAALGLTHIDRSESLHYARRFSELRRAARFDAEYFSPKFQRTLEVLAEQGLSLSDVSSVVERRFDPENAPGDTFQYLEISSVRGDGLVDSETVDNQAAPSRAQWIVEPGDVITSTVRPIRRLSALISEEQSGYVCSSGFAVLRAKEGIIEPEVLLTYLRLPIICEILDLYTTASMYPAISIGKLMAVSITVPKRSIRQKIVAKVRTAFEARAEASRLLDEAKSDVERMVLKAAK